MPVIVGTPREVERGETRVALVPATVPKLTGLGAEVVVESGAGLASFIDDDGYDGARVLPAAHEVYAAADRGRRRCVGRQAPVRRRRDRSRRVSAEAE